MELKNYSKFTQKKGFDRDGASARILALVRDYRSKVAAIRNDFMIPQESKDALIAGEREAAADALNNITLRGKASFAVAKQAARQRAAEAFYNGTSTADVARQEQTARRVRELLDAGVDPSQIAHDAGDRGDTLTLHVLEQEYPVWEWARSGSKPAPEEVDALIGEAKKKAGGDDYAAAVQDLEDLEAAEYAAEVNAAQAAGELQHGDEMLTFLEPDGSTKDVSAESLQ